VSFAVGLEGQEYMQYLTATEAQAFENAPDAHDAEFDAPAGGMPAYHPRSRALIFVGGPSIRIIYQIKPLLSRKSLHRMNRIFRCWTPFLTTRILKPGLMLAD
jgi:hypothetical protein